MYKAEVKKTINNLAKPGKNLSQRTVRSGFWVFSLRIVKQIFGLVKLLILARILAPSDFGLMGIALLAMATLETFSQTGFQTALIQNKKDIKSYLDAAWTVLILRGFILFAILYLIAPYAATFFNASEAKPIIQVIGFAILLQAFTNIGVIYFQKELEFNKEFIYQFAGTLADFIVAVSAALILRNVWALVFGLLAGNGARLIASYLIHPYRPHLSSHLGKARELFSFGKWILANSIVLFITTQGDDIIVGKIFAAGSLGLYQIAYRLSNMPTTEITHVVSQVTFPAYSKLQDKLNQLKRAFLKTLELVTTFSFPIGAGIFILSPEFIELFLGSKWMPALPLIRVFCILGILRSIVANLGSLYRATNNPNIEFKVTLISTLSKFMLIFAFLKWVKWDVLMIAMAIACNAVLGTVLHAYYASKMITVNYLELCTTIVYQSIASGFMVLVIYFVKKYFLIDISFMNFLGMIVIGVLIYFTILLTLDPSKKSLIKGVIPG